MEGLGELLFGYLQLLLGFLELADVTHHHHQCRRDVEHEGFGGDKAGEQLAIIAAKGHLQVADAACLQPLQQPWPDPLDRPDVEVGQVLADGGCAVQPDLFLERLVHFQQAAVAEPGDQQDVWTLLEHRGEFLFGQTQGLFDLLGFADVDHQAAHDRYGARFDQADDVAHPQAATVGGKDAVIEAVIAPGQCFGFTERLGPHGIVRVQDVVPEPGLEPLAQRVAQQVFGVGRDIAVGEIVGIGLPGDGRKALDQAAIMVFAAAQFLLKGNAPGYFRAEPPVDADDHRQDDTQHQQARQAVGQGVMPEGAMVEDLADPALLDITDFAGRHVGQKLVEDAHQDFLLQWRSHGQLVAVGRFARYVQAFELELAQAPDGGGEVANNGIDFVGGQCLQGRTDVGQGHQVEVGVMCTQQLMGCIVFHHGDFQPVELLEVTRLRAALVGQDDNREVQVGAGKCQEVLPFGGRHDAGQQIHFALPGLFKHSRPTDGLDRLDAYAQPIFYQGNVIGGQSLVMAFLVAVLEWRPGGIDAKAQLRVCAEPGLFLGGQGQGVGRCGPCKHR
ncbi:hypothetical protein D9M71_218670 [compost metagenome]